MDAGRRSTRRSSRRSAPTSSRPATSGPSSYRGSGQLGVNPLGSPGRARDHGLGLGQVPRPGGARAGRRRVRQLLDPHGPQHPARHGQERGQLHELAAHQDRGGQGRLRRGHRPRLRRATSRRAAARTSSSCRRDACSRRPLVSSVLPGITRDSVLTLARRLGIPVEEKALPARDALPRRRALLHRHRGRDHADPVGGPAHGRRRARGAPSPRPCRRRSST